MKTFSEYLTPFVRGIHQSLVDSPYIGPEVQIFGIFFGISMNKRLNKKLSCEWSETSWASCEVTVVPPIAIMVIQWAVSEDVMWKQEHQLRIMNV